MVSMKIQLPLPCFSLLALFALHASASGQTDNFGATTETVGRHSTGFETPVNQFVTPAGRLVELPGMRPNALALSPDGQLLVTSGRTHELVVLNPVTGSILKQVAFPSDKAPPEAPVSPLILQPDKLAQLSFTGLT